MDDLRLDGNAAAGTLREIFSFEVTTPEYACGGCGRAGPLGGAKVYEVRELGTIVRCPSCDSAFIRLVHNRGRYLVDLRGRATLRPGSLVEGGLPVASLNFCALPPSTDGTPLAYSLCGSSVEFPGAGGRRGGPCP